MTNNIPFVNSERASSLATSPRKKRTILIMFRNSKVSQSSKAPHSMKSTRVLNTHETKKLNESVEKFQKEYDKKMRKLSVEQTNLLTAHKSRNIAARRSSLPVGSVISPSYPAKSRERKLSCALSDSAINQKIFSEIKADTLENGASYKAFLPPMTFRERIKSPPLLKLPNIKDKNSVESAVEPTPEKSQTVKDNNSSTSIIEKLTSKWNQLTAKIGTECEKVQPLPQLRDPVFSPREIRSTPRRRGEARLYNLKSCTKNEEKISYLRRKDSCPSHNQPTSKGFANAVQKKTSNSIEEKGELVKQMEGLKKCRYLRHLPSSFEESDEFNIDTVFDRY